MDSLEDIIELFSSILVFEIGEKEYCIHLNEVHKIIRWDELTLPVMPDEKNNNSIIVNNHRYPKINLYKYLGLKRKQESKNSRIIIVEINGKIFGFSVEKVKEIISINANLTIHKIEGSHKSCIKGEIDAEDKTLIVIDLEKILENLDTVFHIN